MVWWFRRAIAMGDHDALLELGKCYEAGIGEAKNQRKATLCYRPLLVSEDVIDFGKEQAKRRLATLQRHPKSAA
jgi:hypothetical protein